MESQNGASRTSLSTASTRPVTTVSGGSGSGSEGAAAALKVGVKYYLDDPSKLPQMVTVDPARPLVLFIKDLCGPWGLQQPEEFALQLVDAQNATQMTYVTEKSRDELKNGSVLVLYPSPAVTVKTILHSIQMGDAAQKRAAVNQLATLAPDITFAEELITQGGMELLVTIIEKTGWDKSLSTTPFIMPELTGLILGAFHDLIELHGIVSWDTVDQSVIAKVASYVNKSIYDPATVQTSLTILESLLLNSSKQASVAREISLPHVMEHLKQPSLQVSILSLINAIFARGLTDQARQSLAQVLLSSGTREIILNEVIPLNQTPKPEIAKQLFILQMHLMKVVNLRVMNPTWETETAEKHLQDLRKATAAVLAEVPAVPNVSRKNSEPTEELSRLGFKHVRSPLDDLTAIPEGALVLDCMQYFATKNTSIFRQWILESCSRESSDCPFLPASLHVVQVLMETFQVNRPAGEFAVGEYDRVVFTTEYPFEEAYTLGMQTLCRTWKEMKASGQDFMKVIGALKEKVDLSLRDPPAPPSLEAWRERIKEYTYGKINEIREARKNAKEQLESKAEPIVQLREMLRSEVQALIAENRLRHMQEGTLFSHYERRHVFSGKSKSWKCKLSINKKLLHYGDADESSSGQLANVIGISEIKALLTGKECPHVKNKKSAYNVAFSLALTGENKTLDFIAPNENEFNMWTDGIRVLLGEEMSSPLAASDLEELLTWEIKLRLLGTEGITIPDKIPEMPRLPDNFNFSIAL